jgi:hypothetical protein
VSLLWRNKLRIGLCPDRLIVAGERTGLRQKDLRKEIIPVESGSDNPSWLAAVDALPSAMEPSDVAKLEVTVIVSNHFMRYALLPWNAELRTEAEWESLARHRLAGVYGTTVEDWMLQSSKTGAQGARVVCAADRTMLDAIIERVTGTGAKLVSIQPYLMAAFNRVRGRVGKESCWLVLEERDRLTMAMFRDGAWQAIRSRRVDERWQTMLPEILEREHAMLGIEEPCSQALILSEAEVESWSSGAYRFVDLTLPAGAPVADRQFAMALA